jgi:hypothetical protein
MVEVELLQGFHLRKVGPADAQRRAVGFAVGDLALQHGRQILLARPARRACFVGEFLPRASDRRVFSTRTRYAIVDASSRPGEVPAADGSAASISSSPSRRRR